MYYIKVKTFLNLSVQSIYISIYTLTKISIFLPERDFIVLLLQDYTTYMMLVKPTVLYLDFCIITTPVAISVTIYQ